MSAQHPRDEASKAEGTKERIVAAATALFAAQGYDGTSTKQICQQADVNIAAIHYHFDSKEGLLRHLLESFALASLKPLERILEPAETLEELRLRLRLFLEESLDSYLQQPELWRLVCLECELLQERSIDVFRRTFMRRHEVLMAFLAEAQKKQLVSSCIEPGFAARFIFSQIAHQARFDAAIERLHGVSLRDESYRATWVKQTMHILLCGMGGKSCP